MALDNPVGPNEIMAALAIAEREAFEWAAGQRSTMSTMLPLEMYESDSHGVGQPDRQRTLTAVAEADAAEIRGARERLLNLRALAGLTPEGMDPLQVASVTVARHG